MTYWDKSFKREFSFLLFTVTSTNGFYFSEQKWFETGYNVNLTFENSYAQKSQRNCRFMNSASLYEGCILVCTGAVVQNNTISAAWNHDNASHGYPFIEKI